MEDWNSIIIFIQKEYDQSEKNGYPTTLKRMIGILLESAKVCHTLINYLQDPENQVHKVCAQCGTEFRNPSRWVKTCSNICQAKWIKNPQGYLNDNSTMGSTVLLLNQMELDEKA